MKRLFALVLIAILVLWCGTSVAGGKEELALQIQVVQEHLVRLNEALYFIPFEKKAYEQALKELQEKQTQLNKSPVKPKDPAALNPQEPQPSK